MKGNSIFVRLRQLPPGYSRSLEAPPGPPVTPRPAATLALLREGPGKLEVLLLQRTHRTRFIPKAFVFPGGRQDPEDASPALQPFLPHPTPKDPDSRRWAGDTSRWEWTSRVTALRETFEETGLLLADDGEYAAPLGGTGLGTLREALHRGQITLPEVMKAVGGRLGLERLAYIGHWVTPIQEKLRYDTRFFGAEVPADCPVLPDGVEMAEPVWLTPREALARNREGRLPMVFPTIMTLRAFLPFHSPPEALEALGGREIAPLVPRVAAEDGGVRMTFGEEGPP